MSRPPNVYARNGMTPMQGGALSLNSSTPRLNTPQQQYNARPTSPGAPNTHPAMSRAERFEDEKRRIIESCFSKLDQNGQLAESYITHIRIIEDAQHPSSPPPPDSPAENKKPRLIIIAVRSTGRVRMHKARENNNGSFSIGKTWNLEELSAIESFANPHLPVQSDKDDQHRAWAGSVGFTVTISKPYYWQAGTSKEKDFFIASAVKIYRKYTKGQVPALKGFDDRERNQILGALPGGPPANQTAPAPGFAAAFRAPSDQYVAAPPQPPFAQREQSREGSSYRGSPAPPSLSDISDGGRSLDPPPRLDQPGGPRAFASTEQMRQSSREIVRPSELRPGTAPGQGYGNPPPAAVFAGRSQATASPVRSGSPATNGDHAPPPLQPQSPARRLKQAQPQPIDGASEERRPSNTSTTGASEKGASLFQAARQRYMDYQPHASDQPPRTPPSQHQIASLQATPTSTTTAQNNASQPSLEPSTATSESSPGLDLGDAAAVGALTSYWGPEPTPAAADRDVHSSPEEPHRPTVEHKESDSDLALRPAPLKAALPEASRRIVEPPQPVEEVKPLQIQSRSEPERTMPSAVQPPFLQSSPAPSQPESPQEDLDEHEQYRPGLGPMFKKKAIADRFKKAATAANAFKPRPGGAAEKILKAKADRDGEPDGITGVVPRFRKQDERPMTPVEDLFVKQPEKEATPNVEVSSPQPPEDTRETVDEQAPPHSVELVDEQQPTESQIKEDEQLEQRQIRQPQVKIKRRSVQQEKYLAALGIDRSLLEDRGLDFELMLSDFGWNHDVLQPKQLASLEADIRREQGRVEAGSWLSHTDAAREERVANVESLLDKAIAECDELEGLLTLYHVELSSLNDDIAFIEAQSQGLQVQSANQKLLQTELRNLVDTMSLDRRVLDPLRHGNMSDPAGLDEIESSLLRLYQALLTMDPTIRTNAHNRPRSRNGLGDADTSTMVALREKKGIYDKETAAFCQRLMQFLESRFMTSMDVMKGRILRVSPAGGLAKLHPEAFGEIRSSLWMYSPLLLFTKELNPPAWQTILRIYQQRAATLYQDVFKDNVSIRKRTARASTGDETEILFTAQEKEDPTSGGLTSTARKLTVKRSATLAKTLRNASGDKHTASDHRQPGAMMRAQAFSEALNEMAPLVREEQHFIVDLFHASSLEATDFVDAVHSAHPANRRGTNLKDGKPVEPDRQLAGFVTGAMVKVFDFFLPEVKGMMEWSISEDPIQGVGVMAALNIHAFYLQDSSQDFLQQFVDSLSDSLRTRFSKFVEEQVRAIEDTKVKIKKRKGVIAFMKIFPHFAAAAENAFAAVCNGQDYENVAPCIMDTRRLVDDAYERINRAMFDSLKVIAKESPTAGVQPQKGASGGVDDSEDKEMLNYHILLIENMNHYIEEVDEGSREGVLADWKARAMMDRAEALDAYVGRVLRRPLGKLLDFLESAESILNSQPGNPTALSARPSYSRKSMRTLLSQHDSKEIRRGIDTLRKRIDKHFGDADEEQISRSLVAFVCKECERSYDRVLDRLEKLVKDVYPVTEGEKDVVIDFSRSDIQAGFRR